MITELTKEQEVKIPAYLNKWLKKGHRTKSINKDKATSAIHFMYKVAKAEKPKYIIFLDSPMACNLACNLIKGTKLEGSQLRSQLDSQLGSQLYSQLYSQLGSQLDSQLGSQLGSQLDSQLGSQLDSQLGSQLGSQLDSQLDSQLGSQKLEYFYPDYAGNLWNVAGYYGFYDFILNELLPKKKDDFKLFYEFTEHLEELHYFWMFDGICFVSDFPKEINLNSTNQLHKDGGPALLYRDTYALYKLNGITVTKEIAETTKDQITKEMITKEKNADSRREIVRKVGNEKLLNLLDVKVLDQMDEYQLISFDIGDGRTRPFLSMTCPSTKLTHILGVRPEHNTIRKGLAFLFNQAEWQRPLWEDSFKRKGKADDFKDGQTIYRHGDVNFKKYSGPIGEVNKPIYAGIIHKGNNNNHEFVSGLFEIQMISEKKIVVVLDDSTIGHNEHGDLIIPQGTYEVDIAREYDHWTEEARQVID